MSLYETDYDLAGATYRITCLDTASGLDGIDGKAWLFRVQNVATDHAVNIQTGVESELLAAWQGEEGDPIPNETLIELLAEHLKVDLRQGKIDPETDEDTTREVLRFGTAAPSLSDERARLKGLS